MAIAQDASTPAFSWTIGGTNLGTDHLSGTITQESAAFSPPANSLVVVMAIGSYFAQTAMMVTGMTCQDSLGNGYAEGVSQPMHVAPDNTYGSLAIFTRYYASAPGLITVTVTLDAAEVDYNGTAVDICPLVLTGCKADQAGAATGKLISGPNHLEEVTVVTTATGSWVFIAGVNGYADHLLANTQDIYSGYPDAENNLWTFWRSKNPTGTPGSTTFGDTDNVNLIGLAALEVLPAIGAATYARAGGGAARGAGIGIRGTVRARAGAGAVRGAGTGIRAGARAGEGAGAGTAAGCGVLAVAWNTGAYDYPAEYASGYQPISG